MRRNTRLAGLIVLALSLAVAGTGTAAPRLGGSIVVTSYGSLWEEFRARHILSPAVSEQRIERVYPQAI
jgi:hypothetical protein